VPLALVANNVDALVPTADTVPVIAPVVVFTVRPLGSPVALKLVGVLVVAVVDLGHPSGTGD
jgi:hypothetical protein